MLEIPEEPFVQGDIRFGNYLVVGGETTTLRNLWNFWFRHSDRGSR